MQFVQLGKHFETKIHPQVANITLFKAVSGPQDHAWDMKGGPPCEAFGSVIQKHILMVVDIKTL